MWPFFGLQLTKSAKFEKPPLLQGTNLEGTYTMLYYFLLLVKIIITCIYVISVVKVVGPDSTLLLANFTARTKLRYENFSVGVCP